MQDRAGRQGERAVSEVLAVLLMVAVTIVLAAMVGTVLLNIVSDVEDNALAGVQINFDSENDEIDVVYTVTQKKGTTIEVRVIDSSDTQICSQTITEVGDEYTFGSTCGLNDGNEYTVRVVAESPEGKRSVVREETGSI